jgi:hypothetical protein
MAYTTIDDPSEYFHTQIYTGNGSAPRDITNDANSGDFQPDWVWIKNRDSGGNNHHLFTSSQPGSGYVGHLSTDLTTAEASATNKVIALNSDGFRLGGTHSSVNANNDKYVAWQWVCNGSTTSSNTNGSITSTVQVNDTAGFSIVLYTGNETAGATIGHGLSAAPDVIIVKNRDTNRTWLLGHQGYVDGGNSENLRLNSTDAVASADNQAGSGWHRTAFGSSTFAVGSGVDGDYTSSTNNGTDDHVAYCFREIKGYSKFGKFRGNANADGPFIYTGFKPAWLMIKNIGASGTGYHWYIWDNKRDTFNITDNTLHADQANAENTFDQDIDFLSNGFKLRGSGVGMNPSSHDAVYLAFAEHPFVSSKGVPVTAR